MRDVLDRISTDLTVSRAMLVGALDLAYTRFKKIKVQKRSGGVRVMIQPAVELKLIQAWLDANVVSRLPVSPIATAFQTDTSIVKNARAHKDSLYSVRVDLIEFFPSIRGKDLIAVLERNRLGLENWVFHRDFTDLLHKACFDKEGRLPIGYMSSPRIANCVMHDVDNSLVQTLKADPDRFGRSVLTRYADDFVFSTDQRGSCKEFVTTIKKTLAACRSPKLKVNEPKTRYMSRKGGSTLITGLRVNNEGETGVHANYRDHVRLLLKLFSDRRLEAGEIQSLRGHLAFIEHADPGLFTRLSFKYHEEIAQLRT
jgi:RNA-directed DNA polymerase